MLRKCCPFKRINTSKTASGLFSITDRRKLKLCLFQRKKECRHKFNEENKTILLQLLNRVSSEAKC